LACVYRKFDSAQTKDRTQQACDVMTDLLKLIAGVQIESAARSRRGFLAPCWTLARHYY